MEERLSGNSELMVKQEGGGLIGERTRDWLQHPLCRQDLSGQPLL